MLLYFEVDKKVKAFIRVVDPKGVFKIEWLRQALYNVPRHLFIEQYYVKQNGKFERIKVNHKDPSEDFLNRVYSDNGMMIKTPPDHSAASQPSLVIYMLNGLKVNKKTKVLEIGTGSGWNAGLLAHIVGDDKLVYSIDIQPDLVKQAKKKLSACGFNNINLLAADGGKGWPQNAPFDRIIVTVGAPDIPRLGASNYQTMAYCWYH